jgi:uncharacterized membrane protein
MDHSEKNNEEPGNLVVVCLDLPRTREICTPARPLPPDQAFHKDGGGHRVGSDEEGSMGSVQTPAPAPSGETSSSSQFRNRLDAVDLLRGLVMVIMALDHTRGYFTSPQLDPTNLAMTNAALFFTRWATHFCAPVFIFLAGTGAYLSAARGKTRTGLAWFLVSRGLWIVFLEMTIVRFWWSFNYDYHFWNGGVLWAIGWSMVVLGGLVFLPTWTVTAFGIVLIAVHNCFDELHARDLGPFAGLWAVLHSGEPVEFLPGITFKPQYPLVPWIGVMAAGYGLGALFHYQRSQRRAWLLGLGVALTLAFVILRATNRYGDPHPWTRQPTGLFTVLAFLNCHKYPPSLLFLLMTLGPALAALAWFDGELGPLGRWFVTFGRVPMFFYLLHLPLIHGLAVGMAVARYGPAILAAQQIPEDYGYGLPVVYLIWLGVVLFLFPFCRWFAGVKQRRREVWLSYL